MFKVRRTSQMEPHTGLVDYLAYGEIMRNGEWIPCRIGYNEIMIAEDAFDYDAMYVFINDGITASGNHYNKETLYFPDNCYFIGGK